MIQISKYNKQHPLRIFEAFAGYGSQSLAFKYLKEKHPEFDFKVVGYSEIESSAIQAYGLLHGRDITNYGDVTRIDWNEVPDFDFISWSSPCQDFSNAGLRKGAEEGSGTRSSLIFQERRMLEAKHHLQEQALCTGRKLNSNQLPDRYVRGADFPFGESLPRQDGSAITLLAYGYFWIYQGRQAHQ